MFSKTTESIVMNIRLFDGKPRKSWLLSTSTRLTRPGATLDCFFTTLLRRGSTHGSITSVSKLVTPSSSTNVISTESSFATSVSSVRLRMPVRITPAMTHTFTNMDRPMHASPAV